MEKFVNLEYAQILQKKLGYEFAVITNPEYVHPAFEMQPLAKKITTPRYHLSAAVMDMDGTTTTTEPLCLHSLEYMIRKMSGKMNIEEWHGLDKTIDYPHVIGNSTTKHVEFLIKRYTNYLKPELIAESYIFAAVWTLVYGKDSRRKEEVEINLKNFGIAKLADLIEEKRNSLVDDKSFDLLIENAKHNFLSDFKAAGYVNQVKAGVDIYYQRYHYIIGKIDDGKSDEVSEEVFGKKGIRMIEPMPGVEIFLPLIKGWLGDEASKLSGLLIEDYFRKNPNVNRKYDEVELGEKLNEISARFVQNPLKVAIVTSSILYEANIVMKEVFSILSEKVDGLPLSDGTKEKIKKNFSSYKKYYDAFVTASNTNEIRLKPHRDLYSIALHELGISREMFDTVIGFEDSESGTISIRGAGIGLCIAVPFSETSGHDLTAASYVAFNGIPEIIIDKNIYLDV